MQDRVELTQPNFANRALLRAQFTGLFLLHDALDFGLRLAAFGSFGFGVSLVCAALLGGLDLFAWLGRVFVGFVGWCVVWVVIGLGG